MIGVIIPGKFRGRGLVFDVFGRMGPKQGL
jgi:hypothetical protein